jgi:hypothetical protein
VQPAPELGGEEGEGPLAGAAAAFPEVLPKVLPEVSEAPAAAAALSHSTAGPVVAFHWTSVA